MLRDADIHVSKYYTMNIRIKEAVWNSTDILKGICLIILGWCIVLFLTKYIFYISFTVTHLPYLGDIYKLLSIFIMIIGLPGLCIASGYIVIKGSHSIYIHYPLVGRFLASIQPSLGMAYIIMANISMSSASYYTIISIILLMLSGYVSFFIYPHNSMWIYKNME